MRRPFRLPPGLHTVSVTAYNRTGQVESRPVELSTEVPQLRQRAPRLHILATGVDDYRMYDLRLRFAAGGCRRSPCGAGTTSNSPCTTCTAWTFPWSVNGD